MRRAAVLLVLAGCGGVDEVIPERPLDAAVADAPPPPDAGIDGFVHLHMVSLVAAARVGDQVKIQSRTGRRRRGDALA